MDLFKCNKNPFYCAIYLRTSSQSQGNKKYFSVGGIVNKGLAKIIAILFLLRKTAAHLPVHLCLVRIRQTFIAISKISARSRCVFQKAPLRHTLPKVSSLVVQPAGGFLGIFSK
ncbi:hypothetical protein [Flavobacterium caeni]|uniref:hypothetical protein n=1 Tax=Flavobacterium caeni TaxID=490189 RepID=UPI00111321BB|nr:hypothetical protein [Flavobacterium caeni]